MSSFLRMLEERLVPSMIYVDEKAGTATYFDYTGVAVVNREEDKAVVRNYIIGIIQTKIGLNINVKNWSNGTKGRYHITFETV